MKKVFSIGLTFIAASLLVALGTYKFLASKSHVQNESIGASVPSKTDDVQTAASEPTQPQPLSFNLIDQDGKEVGGEVLKGKVSIVNFVFHSCTTVCPFIMSKTRKLASNLTEYSNQIRLVSVTVDPTNDNTAVLKSWQKAVTLPGFEWTFLGGDKKEVIHAVQDEFKQAVIENVQNMDMPITHSSYIVLVNADATIEGFYDSNDTFKLKELQEKAAKLAANLKSKALNH